ncbi:DODA-type extradiol aromatic ring-opening family dioxygenase [Ascoidea rubescens DSM 1968]|uniref:Extradiol ring-cleavage dioxygenase, class III enzyme, subunit B n=1 Tax=Ascoidea rubescens DSM 1968 TaxID=1344418 RepID=A0A1D2VME3_9ASCO|nr:Extradiol ring-cleavage dioxygenase, class III enzyme, subunit B [Ascoidea rubescens DSM 1968]ODV62786.1 Extradiol ring-cleavage dioxygenase, class III enzyme, subunit B [Ascoidea rubescens DSM 1968]
MVSSNINPIVYGDDEHFINNPTPVYFLSHGGPTFMYEKTEFGGDVGAWRETKKIGKNIINKIKPKFIVSISAHWESNSNKTFEIGIPDINSEFFSSSRDSNSFGSGSRLFSSKSKSNFNGDDNRKLSNDELPLIYDFYGFPNHMYLEKFHSKGSIELAEQIKSLFQENNLNVSLVKRGIDHGVWVPFKVAFSENKPKDQVWDLEMPLIQISLLSCTPNSFKDHYKMGKVLSKLRKKGGLIICSGMSVHNLREMGMAQYYGREYMKYTPAFNSLLTKLLTENKEGRERLNAFENILHDQKSRNLLFSSHPTLEHFMPIIVAAGAAGNDPVKERYTKSVDSLGWNIYEFNSPRSDAQL